MRSVLENSDKDLIPLTKEFELLEFYVKLGHSRFPEKFDYKIALTSDVAVTFFQNTPMLLQPYIKNADMAWVTLQRGERFFITY